MEKQFTSKQYNLSLYVQKKRENMSERLCITLPFFSLFTEFFNITLSLSCSNYFPCSFSLSFTLTSLLLCCVCVYTMCLVYFLSVLM